MQDVRPSNPASPTQLPLSELASQAQNLDLESMPDSPPSSNGNMDPKTRRRTPIYPRKGHTKSRRGCYNCKKRKIKVRITCICPIPPSIYFPFSTGYLIIHFNLVSTVLPVSLLSPPYVIILHSLFVSFLISSYLPVFTFPND